MVLRFNLRTTEKSRLATAAAAIKTRMITLSRARELLPFALGERRESTIDDMVADWHGEKCRSWEEGGMKLSRELL